MFIALIAVKFAVVAVLPELPVHKVGFKVYAPYPERIIGKLRLYIPEIRGDSGVDYRLYAIILLKPLKQGAEYSLGLLI